MGLIKEPLDVDFEVQPKSLTQKEKEAISQYILDYKNKQTNKKQRKKPVRRKTKKQVQKG